jgi:surfactin synthase thioesterase subunit
MELLFQNNMTINDITNYYETYTNGIPVYNLIAIGGNGGGLYGPAYLYENIIKYNYNNCTFTRIDIKYPSFEKYNSKHHFDHATILLKKICHKIYKLNNKPIILIGWSKGGAIVIETAFQLQKDIEIRGIISIAPQLVGTDNLKFINDKTNKIFIHGNNDSVLSHELTELLYNNCNSHKQKFIIEGGDHFLSGNEEYLYKLVGETIQDF